MWFFRAVALDLDAVVTENGAVLTRTGRRRETRLLHEPVDLAMDRALAARGVAAERGQVLVGIDGADVPAVVEVLAGRALRGRARGSRPGPTRRRRGGRPARQPAPVLEEFHRHLGRTDVATVAYHASRGDFSRWVGGALADDTLARELAHIERDLADRHAAAVEDARQQILQVIRDRYLET